VKREKRKMRRWLRDDEVEIFLAKPVGLDLAERKDKPYLCLIFLFLAI